VASTLRLPAKKVNLADPQNLAVVAGAMPLDVWRKSKKKEKSFPVQQSGVAKS
jgi:hypothetical protein